MIKNFELSDLSACAEIMMSVYNNEQWQCRWSLESAESYLRDFTDCKKFLGYTLWIGGEIKGAIFCHEKIWWNNSEVFIDEMFISPQLHRKGYGTEMINVIEKHIQDHNLAGFTLLTSRNTQAPDFYKKKRFPRCGACDFYV